MILVVGSINKDIFLHVESVPKVGETIMASSVKKSAGGKGANQAYAAAKLGGNVTMLGCVGNDENGESLIDSLKKVGVNVDYIKRAENEPTSCAFICVSDSGENAIVVDSSANSLVSADYLLSHEHLFAAAEYCVLQMEIPKEAVFCAFALCKKHDVKIVFNPSPLTGFDKSLLKEVDFLIPNEIEAAQLIGKPYEHTSEADWSEFMRQNEIGDMIITLGKHGCRYYNGKNESVSYPAAKKTALDTTGAGDTFLGALVAALSKNKPMNEAIIFATVASGIEITRLGTQEAVPTIEEIEYELKKRVD